VDATSTRKYGGSGLGLANAAYSVELLGGQIWVESKVREGSVFLFTIVTSEASIETHAHTKFLPLTYADKRVLLIDDNEKCGAHYATLMQKWGLSVDTTLSYSAASEMLQKGRFYDVVIAEQDRNDSVTLNMERLLQPGTKKQQPKRIVLASRMLPNHNGPLPDGLQRLLKPIRHRALYDALSIALADATNQHIRLSQKPVSTEKQSTVPTMDILIAEDNMINEKLIVRILKILGQEVDVTHNGAEAFQAAQQKKYDIILMDIQMPEMDGLEATRRIRATGAIPDRPVIIAMTAHALIGDKEKCIEAGMNDYMSKPILIDEVRRLLQKWHDILFPQNM
jgi:CheY-like chemotaxis protein